MSRPTDGFSAMTSVLAIQSTIAKGLSPPGLSRVTRVPTTPAHRQRRRGLRTKQSRARVESVTIRPRYPPAAAVRPDTETPVAPAGPALVYRLIGYLTYVPARLLFRMRWRGMEHVPAGGCVLAPTHISNLDPWAVGLPLFPRRHLRFMAKAELYRPLLAGSSARAAPSASGAARATSRRSRRRWGSAARAMRSWSSRRVRAAGRASSSAGPRDRIPAPRGSR